jgi:transcriptional regulator with XRE-family HTH domain
MARPKNPAIDYRLLERERHRKGLTLSALADRCRELDKDSSVESLDDCALSRYERGISRPGRKRLQVIAEALDLTEDDLLAPESAAA